MLLKDWKNHSSDKENWRYLDFFWYGCQLNHPSHLWFEVPGEAQLESADPTLTPTSHKRLCIEGIEVIQVTEATTLAKVFQKVFMLERTVGN